MHQLTANLWVRQSRTFQMNSGVFLSNGRACLVDPGMYPDEIDAILGFLTERQAEPSSIVLTHIHWDHILGPERCPGVRVVAHAELPRLAAQQGEEVIADVMQWAERKEVPRERAFAIPRPDETFEQTTTLAVGDLRLRLAHAPGHSPDMLVLYDEETRALWASDILSDVEIPGVAHSLAAYERTLAMLAGWDIRVLVPGHGTPTADRREIAARLGADIAYLRELRSRLQGAVAAGMSPEEAQDACADMTYHHPEENGYIHRYNVEVGYRELTHTKK